MRDPAVYWNDLCNFATVTFATVEDCSAALERHDRQHRRAHLAAVVVRSLLRKAAGPGGWAALTEREQAIVRAYGAGADLPL